MKTFENKGMTIIETAFALMVLGIVFVGLLTSLFFAKQIADTTKNRAKAIQIAKTEMEEVIGTPYTNMVGDVQNAFLYDDIDKVPYTLTTQVVIETVDGQELGKTITITIEWTQQQRICSETLATYRVLE